MSDATAPEVPAATARFAARREAILAAATGILNRQGVKGMTLANVAAEVGLITTSVTYYFRRKEDLAAACFMRGIDSFEALIRESAKAPDARGRLDLFLELFFDLSRRIRRKEAPPMVSFSEMRSLKEPHRTEVTGAFSDMFRGLRSFFDAPEFAGLSRAEANARTHLLLEQAFWTFTWLRRYDIEDYPRLRERMSDILTGGLATRSRSWTPPSLGSLAGEAETAPGGDVSRATFLTAATRLINQKGYRGASVEDISAALNVTKGSFYHHNEDKDELVVACFDRTFAVLRAAQMAARHLQADQWTRLAATASALTEFQLSDEGPLLRGSAMGALPIEMRHRMSDRYTQASERFAGMVADGIAEGSIRPVDPLVAAHMLNALLNAATSLGAWVTGLESSEASRLFVRPLMLGLFTR